MGAFSYQPLSSAQAEAWQELRLEGTHDFPLGFLTTLEEAAAASHEMCCAILDGEGLRGVFEEQKLVGFCGYRPGKLSRIEHRGTIGPFFVTRACQGKGAARVLMQGVINEARESGLAQLELYVDTENHRAIAFYEKSGFKRVATHPDSLRIDGQSRDDHFYVLRL